MGRAFRTAVDTDERLIEPRNWFEGTTCARPSAIRAMAWLRNARASRAGASRSPRIATRMLAARSRDAWAERRRRRGRDRQPPDADRDGRPHGGRHAPRARPAQPPLHALEHHHARRRTARFVEVDYQEPAAELLAQPSTWEPCETRASRHLAVRRRTHRPRGLLAGCTNDPLAEQYADGSGQGYVSGDGAYTEIPADQRDEAHRVRGRRRRGRRRSTRRLRRRGRTSSTSGTRAARRAAPRRRPEAAPRVPRRRAFLGVNITRHRRDRRSFEKEFGIAYPSILDAPTRRAARVRRRACRAQRGADDARARPRGPGRRAHQRAHPRPEHPRRRSIDTAARRDGLEWDPGEIVVERRARGSPLPIALAAGLLSFLSPCVLPLVPGYLGYVERRRRRREQRAAARIVLGSPLFVARLQRRLPGVFVLAGTVGAFLLAVRRPRACASAGVVIILLGLVFIGQVTFLQRTIKPSWQPRTGLGRRPAARHRVRPRLDAVHRPDPHRGQRSSPATAATRAGPRSSASPTASASASRSCSSPSASAGSARLGRLGQAPHPRRSTSSAARCSIVIGVLMVTGRLGRHSCRTSGR